MNSYNYAYNNQYQRPMIEDGDRFFPLVPFLGGALIGGAAVGLTRPRPVFVNQAPMMTNPYYVPYGGGYNYGNMGYYNYR